MAIEFTPRHAPTPLVVHSGERTPLTLAAGGRPDRDRGIGGRKQAKLVFGERQRVSKPAKLDHVPDGPLAAFE
ncbi:hypothetical protein ACGFZK_33805 [Streptomyces sp. NPDC048257]|uniref:hypothetical protein n=1 Tax=Streptomyces sp. NPDC048257 TaxID=3365526 RepID=UPI00371D23E1